MNKQGARLRAKATQAAILAALLWLSAQAFHWRALIFVVLAVIGYGVICLGYAAFIWWLARRR
ncbi:hypothetical protein [Lacticaseibacillus absianus]|uniref:hypothetical protein n=1 Tax=Lacticaseibacillus absianus TaxID=2729623 RepID=UPI0015CBA7F9|nr:hypothetical protein [Lacticaseibacillus absianus]